MLRPLIYSQDLAREKGFESATFSFVANMAFGLAGPSPNGATPRTSATGAAANRGLVVFGVGPIKRSHSGPAGEHSAGQRF